ncbi:4,5:9,10-diseco-3-hydroxy-5,9,17-trioxoandrosta-1(10),2-diene-4-oate hydrolase [Methanobrevibacter cuticularis]|uniref:4,5:9,10-diseco-3-hydroxy-5,9, 17-trioxoandrosta-1(10),2-diene-4-oate hydrolase n=1 Tax=Methanobrevibacter cuticularis TaxID=47311 RepID=A0A166E1B1_9EURY|nr:alpha/beta hydrolase [Methanobrevibacter cuticularis]KZX16168.1 4,5:9,10-diseco-3-hydroxy-5,9,17-trioxoandrosta-1(10),2-diene-4-oate hydrolase [Methanobrevibacter cuticularis]
MEKELYYEEEGKDNKETIIFIHSNFLSNWIWKNQRSYFNNSYHCVYIDLPKHGNSSFKEEFSIKDSAILIKELIEKIAKNKKAHLVGVSLGGQIILYILSKYPEVIDNAVITGVNLKATHDKDDKIANLINSQKERKIDNLLTLVNQLQEDILGDKSPDFIIKAYLAEYGLQKEYYKELKESIENSNNSLISITKESLKFKFSKPNSIKNKNLLVLFGTKEYPKIVKSAELIKETFPEAQIFNVYRAIHLWNIIDYEWFNEILMEFLTKKCLSLNEKPYLKRFK